MIKTMSSDEEDLFTNINKTGIETLGNVYKSEARSTMKAASVERNTQCF